MTEREPEKVNSEQKIESQAPGEQTEKPELVGTKPGEEKTGLPPLARQVLRTLLGMLIIFLLGFLAAMVTLYTPAQGELERVKTEIQRVNEKAATLASVEKDLSSAQDKIKTLQGDLDKAVLDVKLLRVITSLHQAQLALSDKDGSFAQLYLKKTPQALEELGVLLGDEYTDLKNDLQSRLQQVLGELSKDPIAAKSDLKVVEEKLLLLENTLFKSP